MKRKIVLISSFCDTDEKKEVLKENLEIIKNLGLETILISPNFLPIDDEIVRLSDFTYFTKENPILKYPERNYSHWFEMNLNDGRVLTLHRHFADYGWAALYQTKKLSQIALSYDYDIFYHMVYDLEINDLILDELKGEEVNFVHPRINPRNLNQRWDATLHFMVFDRKMMEKIQNEISLTEYRSTNGFAEDEVIKWTKKLGIKISEHPIKDRIYYWGDSNFFDYSPFADFKLFVSKNPPIDIWLKNKDYYKAKLTENFRIVFYDFERDLEIKLKLNNLEFKLKPKKWEFIEIPISSQEVNEFTIEYRDEKKDFSKNYSEIILNQIYYNFLS